MSNDFLPLSGAILVTNPRKKVNTMFGALALDNPNDRRRFNKLARLVVQEGMSPRDVVALWEGQKHLPKLSRDPRLQRTPPNEKLKAMTKEERKEFYESLPKQSPADREAYARARDAIADEFAALEGYKTSYRYVPRGKGKPAQRYSSSYQTRIKGSKAKRYYLHRKKNKRLGYKAFGRKGYQIVDIPGIRGINKRRIAIREEKDWKQGDRNKAIKASWAAGSPSFYDMAPVPWNAKSWGRQIVSDRKPRRSKKSRQASKQARGPDGRFVNNPRPGTFGALALDNPRMQGFAPAAMHVASLGAAGAVGYYGVRWIRDQSWALPIQTAPVVSMAPTFTIGALGGLLTGLVAARTSGPASKLLGTAAAGMVVAGAVLQSQEGWGGGGALAVSEDDLALAEEELGGFGALALDNFGALALDNTGVFGGIGRDNYGYGDGMAYEIGPLTMDNFSQSYSDASLADAYYSGADFDATEGQLLIAGAPEFQKGFGHCPKRIAAHGGPRKGASHLAGRRGHRWGWMIKVLGQKRVSQIAAMPPRKRLALIRKLRQNAIHTYNLSVATQEGAPEFHPQHVSGNAVSAGANGPNGAHSSYGAMLFAGDDIF